MMKTYCDVYRSKRHQEMYLYVRRGEGLSKVPEDLLTRFGHAELALSFELTPSRRLAKEDPVKVRGMVIICNCRHTNAVFSAP